MPSSRRVYRSAARYVVMHNNYVWPEPVEGSKHAEGKRLAMNYRAKRKAARKRAKESRRKNR